MVCLNIGRKTYFHSLLWLFFIVLTTDGCLGYTVYCEVGAGVCLDFLKNNSFDTYAIRIGNLPVCMSFDGQSTYLFINNLGNESSFNCSVSKTIMSACIGNFQPEDAGTYSLHGGLASSSNLLKSITVVKGSQQFNMTGSSEFASLRQSYTWTCSMFVPPGQTINAINFYKDSLLCVAIGYTKNDCFKQSANPRYTYGCLSDYVYTLTIPAENMTEYEQGSLWRCEYVFNSSYRSSDVILKIANIKGDQNKETSNYTTLKEQQEQAERNVYDELVSRENASQYEDVLKKDNHGRNEKLYEKLQKSVDNDGEGKAIKKMIPLKSKESSDDKSVTQKAEEYANTSFMK